MVGLKESYRRELMKNPVFTHFIERRAIIGISLAVALLIALGLVACSSSSSTQSLPAGFSDAVTGKVDVGGYELYYLCVGEGSPTVILEAGGGEDSSEWNLVMLYYRKYTRICAYDRADQGNSDTAVQPRTYADATRDLHALLQNAAIEGPYILVGHSGGGMIAWLYASQYPDDLVGLVLVDSAHPDMGDRLLAALPAETPGEDKSLDTWRKYATLLSSSNGRGLNNIEGMDMEASNAQVRAVTWLGDLPLAILSRSPDNPILMPGIPALPEEINASLLQQWQEMQTELEGLSSDSTRFIAEHSGHGIPEEEPRTVVEAIRYIVDETRAEAGIVIPPAVEATGASSHAPVITGITEREKWVNGTLMIYADIAFTDPAGDAITIINTLVASHIPGTLVDDVIWASVAEQKAGAVLTSSIRCRQAFEATIEVQVYDMAGNVSNAETIVIACPAPNPYVSPWVIGGLVVILAVVGAGTWLLVRNRRRRRTEKYEA